MTRAVKVTGVSVGYGSLTVLHDVDLHVDDAEIVAVIGANGAGKTTLLRAASGLRPLQQGDIQLHGTSVRGIPAERVVGLGLAHVPENRLVFGGLSVEDNLRLGAYRTRDSALVRERILFVTDMLPRLAERMPQVASTLSGGEQQMLAIGRALMSGPSILLLDEPSVGIAPQLVRELFTTLSRLRDATGTTLLVVEQNVSAALAIADRAYVLDRGRVEFSGPADQVRADPRVTSAFLGT